MCSLQHNRYGVGYHMVVTKEENCDSQTVIECVTSTIPGGEMVSVHLLLVCRTTHIKYVRFFCGEFQRWI